MKTIITVIVFFLLLTKAHASDDPCERYKSLLLWGIVDSWTVKYTVKGTMNEAVNKIEKAGYSLGDFKEILLKYEERGYTYLYEIDLDGDGLKDFAVMAFGGSANCTHPVFLKTSKESNKLTLMKGIDSSNYENEDALCDKWGQEISFFNNGKDQYVVVRDLTERLSNITFELYKAGLNEKTKGICKIKMSVE